MSSRKKRREEQRKALAEQTQMYDLPRRYFACINGEYYIYSVSKLGEKGILLKTRKNPLENAEIIEDDDISIVLIDEKDERISDIFTGRIDFIYNEPEMGEEGYSYHYNLGDNSIGAECTTLYGTSAWAGWEQIGKDNDNDYPLLKDMLPD